MLDINKKFLQAQDDDAPHIGALLKTQFAQFGIKKASVRRSLGVSETSLYRYFRQRSIQVMILWRISKFLKYNFFMALGERLPIPFETTKEKELQLQLKQREADLEDLREKLSYLEGLLKR